jgi:hypothetical protein
MLVLFHSRARRARHAPIALVLLLSSLYSFSGIINLQSRLTVGSNNVTIAGQTSPGKGICIRSAPFGMGGNDVVVRHMRVRVGAGITYDGMGLNGNNSIIDNCSISWTIDEAFSSRSTKDITLQ